MADEGEANECDRYPRPHQISEYPPLSLLAGYPAQRIEFAAMVEVESRAVVLESNRAVIMDEAWPSFPLPRIWLFE